MARIGSFHPRGVRIFAVLGLVSSLTLVPIASEPARAGAALSSTSHDPARATFGGALPALQSALQASPPAGVMHAPPPPPPTVSVPDRTSQARSPMIALPALSAAPRRAAMSLPASTMPTTYVVYAGTGQACATGTPEPTIDAALTTAQDGDTILICPGTYPVGGASTESSNGPYLIQHSNVTVSGVGSVAIDASAATRGALHSGVFDVASNGVALSNMTLEGASSYAVTLQGQGETLTSVTLPNNGTGIAVLQGTARLIGVTVTGSLADGLVAGASAVTSLQIADCSFDANIGAGLQLAGSAPSSTITLDHVSASRNGADGVDDETLGTRRVANWTSWVRRTLPSPPTTTAWSASSPASA
jgi:hypothetical protein